MPQSDHNLEHFAPVKGLAWTTPVVRSGWFGKAWSNGWKWWMAAMLAVFLVAARNGIAQESSAVPATEEPETALAAPGAEPAVPRVPRVNGPLTPVGPDTFILLDAQGRPQPVLGMTYEEFIEAWKKLRELDDADMEPTYIVEALHAEGRIEGDAAVLNVRFEIELKTSDLVELPLGFKDAILSDSKNSDPAVQLSYDETRGGYVAWVRSSDQKKLVVNLPLLVPLKRDGNKTSLQINVPRALVNQLQFDSPQRIVSPVVSEGAVARLSDRGDDGSRITVTGLVGDIALSWSAPGSEATALETVLSVAGQIATSVDGRSARSEARLRVESFGGQFQQFRLRLPPGAQLVAQGAADTPESQAQYKLVPEVATSSTGENKAQTGQVWVVELAEATSGPVDVRLATEQAIGLSRENAPIELGGFEVLGAVRQFGQLALRVDPNWQLRWNRLEGGRQINVDDLDQETSADPALFAFEYNQQPWSLPVEVQPRGTRVAVSPKYRLELFPDEARLKVTLQYQLAGSQEMRFRVKLAGWEVTADPIEPTRLIDANEVLVTRDPVLKDDVLELPLTQAASRRTEITFHARRSLTEERSKLELPLPTPLADSIGTGELAVLAHPSLLVVPSPAQEGLAPLLTGETETAGDASLVHIVAYRSFLPDRLVFSADVGPRAGEVEAAVETRVSVTRQLTQVEHSLSFDAKYRPLSEVNLSMPSALMRDPSFRLTLLPGSGVASSEAPATPRAVEGVPLEVRAGQFEDATDSAGTRRVISVALPQPRLGKFRLLATYSLPTEVARDVAPSLAVVPLPLPIHVPITSQIAVVSARELEPLELAPTQRDSVWSVAPTTDSELPGATVLKASDATSELPLSFLPARAAGEGRTIIDQIWLQSWCAPEARQQRAVYHVRSNARSLTIELPLGMVGHAVEVSLDGMTNVECERREAQLVVPLVESDELAAHTLQLRYLESTGIDPWDQLQMELPQVGGEAIRAGLYWQVIVPKNYLILHGPSGLAKAHGWKWTLDGLRPNPLMATRELEASIGTMEQREPAEGESEYLYSGFASGPMLTVAIARSELLHLIAAGLVLAAGLGLLYLPILRRPGVLFAVSVAVIFAGVAYPEMLMVCGPALAIGAALTLLACLLYLLVPRRVLAEPSISTSTVHGTHLSSRENFLSSPMAASSNAPTITMRPSESNV